MISHDYHDNKCGRTFEVTFDSSLDFTKEVPCECGGVATQIWLRAPGLAGVEEPGTRGISRSFIPGHDIQSGKWFNTRAERDRYVKSKGGYLMGPEEHKRSRLAQKSDPEPDYSGLVPAMEKAYEQAKSGNVEPLPTLDPSIPILEAK